MKAPPCSRRARAQATRALRPRAGIPAFPFMRSLPSALALEIRCQRLPAACAGAPVYLGIQHRHDVIGIVPASLGKAAFTAEFRLTDTNGSPNFLGPFAQGPRHERFFYLSWGTGATNETFGMFRRLKVHLSQLTWRQISAASRRKKPLRVTLDLTDACSQPLCGSAWPDHPAVTWDLK